MVIVTYKQLLVIGVFVTLILRLGIIRILFLRTAPSLLFLLSPVLRSSINYYSFIALKRLKVIYSIFSIFLKIDSPILANFLLLDYLNCLIGVMQLHIFLSIILQILRAFSATDAHPFLRQISKIALMIRPALWVTKIISAFKAKPSITNLPI